MGTDRSTFTVVVAPRCAAQRKCAVRRQRDKSNECNASTAAARPRDRAPSNSLGALTGNLHPAVRLRLRDRAKLEETYFCYLPVSAIIVELQVCRGDDFRFRYLGIRALVTVIFASTPQRFTPNRWRVR